MRLLILGGTGFIGSNVAKLSQARGVSVSILSRSRAPAHGIGDTTFYSGDVSSRESLSATLRCARPTHVLYAASSLNPRTELTVDDRDRRSEQIAISHLLDLLDPQTQRLVYLSSAGTVYGNTTESISEDEPLCPISIYGHVKVACEQLIVRSREKGLQSAILRLSNPYGPGQDPLGSQGFIAILIGKLLESKQCSVYDNSYRDYIFIDDAVEAIWKALLTPGSFTLNIASGTSRSAAEVAQLVCREVQMPTTLLSVTQALPHEVGSIYLSIERAESFLKWCPTTILTDGLRLTIPYVKSIVAKYRDPGIGEAVV